MRSSDGTLGSLKRSLAPTGGRSFAARDPKKLTFSTAELISSEIRHEYVLGYVPSNRQMDGGFHRVHLNVSRHGTKDSESPIGRDIMLERDDGVAR